MKVEITQPGEESFRVVVKKSDGNQVTYLSNLEELIKFMYEIYG